MKKKWRLQMSLLKSSVLSAPVAIDAEKLSDDLNDCILKNYMIGDSAVLDTDKLNRLKELTKNNVTMKDIDLLILDRLEQLLDDDDKGVDKIITVLLENKFLQNANAGLMKEIEVLKERLLNLESQMAILSARKDGYIPWHPETISTTNIKSDVSKLPQYIVDKTLGGNILKSSIVDKEIPSEN